MARVGAVILAAGGSSRFGEPKQLVRFRGQTLLDRAIEAARAGACDPVIVVIGSESGPIRTDAAQGIVIAENVECRAGIASSIRVGVQRLLDLSPEADGVLLLACDQPLVTGEIVAGLIDHWSRSEKQIGASVYAGTLGIPAVFSRSYFKHLLHLEGDSGAKSIILTNREDVAEFSFPGGSEDIDTRADLLRIEQES
ncbi:MAG: NTP transferase domain-containing protein [Chthoniobacterales bacterium]